MALHDPESTAQEKALALKLGRQKKIQIIDGKQVDITDILQRLGNEQPCPPPPSHRSQCYKDFKSKFTFIVVLFSPRQ